MSKHIFSHNKNSGFTLIEILVVVAIIGMISGVVMVGLNTARSKGRDAKRKADLVQLQKALEIYYNSNNSYPTTGDAWFGTSVNGGNRTTSGANAYIPGLTPTYVSSLPTDPANNTSGWSGYLYRSDGINYKILAHTIGPESYPSLGEDFYDPIRPGSAWMVCNGDIACSTW